MANMLATEIRALRSERGMSQVAFADAVDLTDGMVGLVETGRRLLSVDSIEGVVAGLGLTGAERERLLAARRADVRDRKRRTPVAERIDDLEAQMEALTARVNELAAQVTAKARRK